MSHQQLSILESLSPDDSRLNQCLKSALHHYSEADTRWEKWMKRGLTDDELKECIGHEFGISGGYWGGDIHYAYSGGKNPKFWVGENWNCKPTLQGKKLISKVRELLSIPYPN